MVFHSICGYTKSLRYGHASGCWVLDQQRDDSFLGSFLGYVLLLIPKACLLADCIEEFVFGFRDEKDVHGANRLSASSITSWYEIPVTSPLSTAAIRAWISWSQAAATPGSDESSSASRRNPANASRCCPDSCSAVRVTSSSGADMDGVSPKTRMGSKRQFLASLKLTAGKCFKSLAGIARSPGGSCRCHRLLGWRKVPSW